MGGTIDKLTERDLVLIEKFSRPASVSLRLGVHCDRKLKNHSWAGAFYREYFSNPWSKRVLEEARRLFIDDEAQRSLKSAYAQHDGIAARRILKALAVRLMKVPDGQISAVWKTSFKKAIEWEIDHLPENIVSFPFWTLSELSARSVHLVAREMFLEERFEEPSSLRFWRDYFSRADWVPIPSDLDPDSLGLWQIRVEQNPDLLSEALLRFPAEDRFLFLWSLRRKEPEESQERLWPSEQKESSVVRKNLERAFDKAKDKLVWFDRLRQSGCSQDFYEYVVNRTRMPVKWILSDIDSGQVISSQPIRNAIRDQLATLVPQQDEAFSLSAKQITRALSYLTPAETQQVLLSRYVMSDIPKEILTDEYLELFWDARGRVEPATFERWTRNILAYLASMPMKLFQARHYQWVQAGWDSQPETLEKFSPAPDLELEFPWTQYLDQLERHGRRDLLIKCVHRIPDERLKESWLHQLMVDSEDPGVFAAINTLKTDYVRFALLSQWYDRRGDLERALSYREQELEACPIINEQMAIARSAVVLAKRATEDQSIKAFQSLQRIGRFLELNGGLDCSLCRELSLAAYRFQQWDQAWKWAHIEWARATEAERANLLEHFLDVAFQARAVEDAQRILVEYIFRSTDSNSLTYEILNQLLTSSSSFKLRHLRREFVDQATQIFPLHPEVLRARAGYDYRALLLWECFYGEEIEARASLSTSTNRRKFELWGLTDSSTHAENFSKFSHYIETIQRVKIVKQSLDFLDDAKRIAQRLSKHFGIRKEFQIVVTKGLEIPFQILVSQPALQVNEAFFKELDEEIWGAICVGTLQVLQDFDRGLYEPRRLMERFFQALFLSGAPIASIIRLWIWLAVSEGLASPQIVKSDPEKLVENLPFINSLLIFYLSPDFETKAKSCGLLPS